MQRLWRQALLTLILGGLTLGCTRSAVQQKQPPDPLLWSKRSVTGKPPALEAKQTSRNDDPATMRDHVATLQGEPPAPIMPVRLQVGPLLADRASARLLPPDAVVRDR